MDRRLTRRGRARRDQLVDFAARRFAENGYHSTSVTDIVNGLGVGKGVFYWYFASKDELFCEILADAQRSLRRRQQQAIADEDDPVRRLEQGMRASITWLGAHPHLFALVQLATSEERFAGMVRAGEDVAVADTARHVKEGMATGRIPGGDPFAVAHAVLGVTNHLTRALVVERGEKPDDVADAAVAFCLHGILARPTTP
ncbi:MAG: TetR/AcrR family transcriptional regulator [Actinomycetota bacterium]|nr:TetR/AcrR family transcriptional regulator [Actinomycetota bacterium]